MAGTGKSTISRTVANFLRGKKSLGASFFFKRGEENRGNAKRLFPTLIKQLVTGIPQLIPSIRKATEDDPNISEKSLREQFDRLLLQPLLTVKLDQTATMVIVIDALDECEGEDDIRVILQLLPQVLMSNSVYLRFFLTSRPELPIRLGFKKIGNQGHQNLNLHAISNPDIEQDISLFLRHNFSRIRQERSLSPDWPGDENIQTLVARTVPLFISAATVCRFIGDLKWNPENRLKAIIADQATYVSKMDSTYLPVLNQLLAGQDEWESKQLVQEFKEIVGVIILLATPLSVNALARLLNMKPYDISTRLDLLHSVLSVPENLDLPVRLLHLSFRDFLLDSKKKGNSPFWLDEKEIHRKTANQCLTVMQGGLRKNICNLPAYGILRIDIHPQTIARHLSADLQYACRYWVHHLKQGEVYITEKDQVHLFLEEHFLEWLESMSILGAVSECISLVDTLDSLKQVSASVKCNWAIINDTNGLRPRPAPRYQYFSMMQNSLF